jgi:integrase
MLVVFLGTGLRVGELTGLQWSDIDFKNEKITVNHSLTCQKIDGDFYFTIGKSKDRIRTVPMSAKVREALHNQKCENFKNGLVSPTIDGYTDFVFLNGSGNLFSTATINEALDRIVKAYNEQENAKAVLLPHMSVHMFRHYFFELKEAE